jgi:hypothetical protein
MLWCLVRNQFDTHSSCHAYGEKIEGFGFLVRIFVLEMRYKLFKTNFFKYFVFHFLSRALNRLDNSETAHTEKDIPS